MMSSIPSQACERQATSIQHPANIECDYQNLPLFFFIMLARYDGSLLCVGMAHIASWRFLPEPTTTPACVWKVHFIFTTLCSKRPLSAREVALLVSLSSRKEAIGQQERLGDYRHKPALYRESTFVVFRVVNSKIRAIIKWAYCAFTARE